MAKSFTQYTLKNINTSKSIMTAIELHDFIDFEVKRIYFISQIIDKTSAHCHYEEKEFFIMIQGNCVATIDRGHGIEEISMIAPQTALYIPNFVWHGFDKLSKDAILLAASSTNYRPDRSDYLDNYSDYLQIRDEKLKMSE